MNAEQWNETHPVGTVVRYWPGAREDEGRASRTRTPAWTLGGHTPVVMVEGHPGGVALTHVEVCEGPDLLTALHELAVAADRAAAQDTTRETIETSLAVHREHTEACEAYRRRHYPRAHRIVAVFGEVFTVSKTGRSIRRIYP